jgi:uncharacterized protein YwgA
MASISQKILARTLLKLQEKGWPLEKIIIQKVLYFLKTQNIPVGWDFEPYTYGPFSFALSSELNSMAYSERIMESNNCYLIKSLEGLDLDDDISGMVDSAIELFMEIVENKHDFGTMELYSTVLYCKRALEHSLGEVKEEDLISDFREWKDTRYSDEQIQKAFDRLQR